MTKLKSFLLFLFVLASFFIVLYGLGAGWYSFVILSVVTVFFTTVGLQSSFREEKGNIIPLFLGVFGFYVLYMMITNYLYVDDPSSEFFMMVDSMKFWNYSDYKMYSVSDVFEYQRQTYQETIRYTLFNFGNLLLSFFSQIFDENNILVQKLQSVWLGALSIPFVYLCFRKYFEKDKSFKYALIYAVFTHVCIYSVVFNRDPHVYFLYTVATYYVIHYDRKKNILLKLIVLFVLTCGYRLEHGLFFLLFILAYLYLRSSKDSNLRVLVVVLIPITMVIISPFLLGRYAENTESYQEQIDRVERTEASTAAALSKLPPGIKQITMAVNSQVAPAVPFWRPWFANESDRAFQKYRVAGYFTPWRFMESVASITWIYVWVLIALGLIQKKYKLVPKELNYLFLVAVLLLMAASTSVNARRTYCVSPIIFMYAAYIYSLLPAKKRKVAFSMATMTLVGITILYLTVRGV